MNINTSNMADNAHFINRYRNMRNDILAQTDRMMLQDNYEKLTEGQKLELIHYRQSLREFMNINYDEIYNKGKVNILFPLPLGDWLQKKIYIPKY